MYVETSVYLGTRQQAHDLYGWLGSYSANQPGVMTSTLAVLADKEIKSHGPLIKALEEKGLYYAVIVSEFECDDETDQHLEEAQKFGMFAFDKDHEGMLLPGEVLHLEDGMAVVEKVPFRLEIWTPLLRQS